MAEADKEYLYRTKEQIVKEWGKEFRKLVWQNFCQEDNFETFKQLDKFTDQFLIH